MIIPIITIMLVIVLSKYRKRELDVNSTADFVIQQISFAHPDAVHGAHFGAHWYHDQAIAAAGSQSAFVQLARQRAHEARETEIRIHT